MDFKVTKKENYTLIEVLVDKLDTNVSCALTITRTTANIAML